MAEPTGPEVRTDSPERNIRFNNMSRDLLGRSDHTTPLQISVDSVPFEVTDPRDSGQMYDDEALREVSVLDFRLAGWDGFIGPETSGFRVEYTEEPMRLLTGMDTLVVDWVEKRYPHDPDHPQSVARLSFSDGSTWSKERLTGVLNAFHLQAIISEPGQANHLMA